jgi:hypothetical protein
VRIIFRKGAAPVKTLIFNLLLTPGADHVKGSTYACARIAAYILHIVDWSPAYRRDQGRIREVSLRVS